MQPQPPYPPQPTEPSLDDLLDAVRTSTERIAEARERLDRRELTGSAANGEVTARLRGDGQFIDIYLDPETLRRYEPGALGSFVVDAVNDGLRKLREAGDAAFGPLIAEIPEPGR